MSADDQAILKPYVLGFFDFMELDDADISRLAKTPADYRRIFSKRNTRLQLLSSLVKKFNYKADYDNFTVQIPFEYEGYKMSLELGIDPEDPDFLEGSLYRDATKMTDRFPEYYCSVTDLDNGDLIDECTVGNNEYYIKKATDQIRDEDIRARCGNRCTVYRSDLERGREYELKLEFKGFAYLD